MEQKFESGSFSRSTAAELDRLDRLDRPMPTQNVTRCQHGSYACEFCDVHDERACARNTGDCACS